MKIQFVGWKANGEIITPSQARDSEDDPIPKQHEGDKVKSFLKVKRLTPQYTRNS